MLFRSRKVSIGILILIFTLIAVPTACWAWTLATKHESQIIINTEQIKKNTENIDKKFDAILEANEAIIDAIKAIRQ